MLCWLCSPLIHRYRISNLVHDLFYLAPLSCQWSTTTQCAISNWNPRIYYFSISAAHSGITFAPRAWREGGMDSDRRTAACAVVVICAWKFLTPALEISLSQARIRESQSGMYSWCCSSSSSSYYSASAAAKVKPRAIMTMMPPTGPFKRDHMGDHLTFSMWIKGLLPLLNKCPFY